MLRDMSMIARASAGVEYDLFLPDLRLKFNFTL